NGKRFVNEVGSRDELAQAAINVGGFFYLIADDKIKETAYNTNQEKLDQQVAAGTLFRDDTIEGLASQIGIDPAVLADTVAKYNSRSEEHTSELQSRFEIVYRLMLEEENR